MGVKFDVTDSTNLISAMRNNLTNVNAIIDRLHAGSRHLIGQLDAGVLQGAAFTAGRGLFCELIIPAITKLSQAVDDLQAELASYEYAHSVVAEEGDLDHDDLKQALRDSEDQLRLIEQQIEQNKDLFTQANGLYPGFDDTGNLMHQSQVLERLKAQVGIEIDLLEKKIAKLEWFVADVSNYFSDSLQVMKLATQAATELNKVAVETDGSYYTNGVNLLLIQALLEAKISTNDHAPDADGVYHSLEFASNLSYDKLLEWLASEEGQQLRWLALEDPRLFNSMLRNAMVYKVDGNPVGALGAALDYLKQHGWVAFAGGEIFLEKFKTWGDWDMKRYLDEEYHPAPGAFDLRDEQGRDVRSDVFGNVNYGIMLGLWGVDLETALKGANSGNAAGVNAGVNHDELDDRAVAFGFELYKKYPNGTLTKEKYFEELANAKLFE